MLSALEYNDYVLLAASFDAEWCKRPVEDSATELGVNRVMHEVEGLCHKYRQNVEQNLQKMRRASLSDLKEETIDPTLYKPRHYIPLGHADVQTFTLFDDFDPIQHLTANVTSAVEDATLAFCPKKRLFDPRKEHEWLLDAHEIIALPEGEFPLMTFTRFKIDAMATIGVGLLAQEAIFKAIVSKTCDVLEDLKLSDQSKETLWNNADLKQFRMCLLDLQGPEEVGVISVCSNYTIATSVVAGIRALAFKDLFASERLKEALDGSFAHRRAMELMRDAESGGQSASAFIQAQHVVRWSNTIVGVEPSTLLQGRNLDKCNGRVEASGNVQVASGHHHHVCERLLMKQQDNRRFHLGAVNLKVDYGTPGPTDRLITIQDALNFIRTRLIEDPRARYEHADVLDWATQLSVPLPPASILECSESKDHRSSFADLLAALQQWLFDEQRNPDELSAKGCFNLRALLTKPKLAGIPLDLRRSIENLFQYFRTLIGDAGVFDGVLDLYDAFAAFHRTLTEHLVELRKHEVNQSDFVPPMDSASMEQLCMLVDGLYNALSHRVSKTPPDSHFRDMAIDFRGGINQIVLAAHVPVTCGLGIFRKYVFPWDGSQTPRTNVGGMTKLSFNPGTRTHIMNLGVEQKAWLAVVEADVAHILHPSNYVDYIHECVHLILPCLRLLNVDPGRPTLNNFRSTSGRAIRDNRLKLSVPELRWLEEVLASETQGLRIGVQERVSNAIRHSLTQGTHSTKLTSRERHKIAANLEKAMRDDACPINERSKARLLSHIQAIISGAIPGSSVDESLWRERIDEVFTDLLTHMIVYGGDRDAFIIHKTLSWGKSQRFRYGDDEELYRGFSEFLVRLFMVCDAIPQNDPSLWKHQKRWNRAASKETDVQAAFVAFLNDFGTLLPKYELLWKGELSKGRLEAVRRFKRVYRGLKPGMQRIWNVARNVFIQYSEHLEKSACGATADSIAEDAKSAFAEGRPLIRSLHHAARPSEDDINDSGLDALVLGSALIRESARDHTRSLGAKPYAKEIYLYRNPETYEVVYPETKKADWHEFQIDRGAAVTFSPIPSARRRRVQHEIVMIKTFWDLSSNMRARRLFEMLNEMPRTMIRRAQRRDALTAVESVAGPTMPASVLELKTLSASDADTNSTIDRDRDQRPEAN